MLVLNNVYSQKPPKNLSTIQDIYIPGLSKTLSFNLQDFPGLENEGKNPGLSTRHENPSTFLLIKQIDHFLDYLKYKKCVSI